MAKDSFTLETDAEGNIRMPGEVLDGSLADFLGKPTPEEDRKFQEAINAIREAERRAFVESRDIVLGSCSLQLAEISV